jgi:hypothetical protein
MKLKLRGLALVSILFLTSSAVAAESEQDLASLLTSDHFKITEVKFEEVDSLRELELVGDYDPSFKASVLTNPIDSVGRVIAIGKDLVALGESVYQLVLKGKPVVKTSYAPISVLPNVNGGPADIFETEGWTAPVKRTYQIKYNNLYGATVIHFMFSVIYSYNGSLDGKGAYLTAVQIIPEYVKSLWGWEFTATMKLGGLQNMGTKSDPVAGATIMIEYNASSLLENIQRTNSFFLTGKGQLKFL